MQPCSYIGKVLHALVALAILLSSNAIAETVSIVIPTNASPRVQYAAELLAEALRAAGNQSTVVRSEQLPGRKVFLNHPPVQVLGSEGFCWQRVVTNDDDGFIEIANGQATKHSGYAFQWSTNSQPGDFYVLSGGDSGALYGCLDLARRIRATGALPKIRGYEDRPTMTLRGTCIGMQKTYILPGRKVYEYPYTPELFPWFYDKERFGPSISTRSSPTA
jgi:hypothetical protein